MRWQRIAQFAIACFVLVFVAAIVVSMRRSKPASPDDSTGIPQAPADAQVFNPGGGKDTWFTGERKAFDAQFGKHVGFADGRHVFSEGIRVTTNRNGKDLLIEARDADVRTKGREFQHATFKGDVRLTTADGIAVKAAEASYAESEGIVKIPGTVEFRKGRTSGKGVGATYDMNRAVLWILDKAEVNVAPGPDGKGALEGVAASAGLARFDHYLRLTRDARITGEGRVIQANEITITLTEDDERVKMLQLRGNSSITGGAGGPQSMSANDIDVMYGADGRTLQTANLMENAVVQLAGGGKRIAGKVINIGMGSDGTTVTSLTATGSVQVDLPAENGAPAKTIRSATMQAGGASGTGLQNATFGGKVEYRETRAAQANVTAVDRTARSETLVIDTKPGLGAIQNADFRGNVRFDDAPEITAEAPRGVYHVDRDRIELMPSQGDPGLPARVTDGKISVGARTIQFTLGTRDLSAETNVRSTLLAKPAGRGQQQSRIPSVMKQGEPVNVTANRLRYQGAASTATYSGNVVMWQEGESATIKGDTLTLDDNTGNLEVNGNAVTDLLLEETDKKTNQRRRTRSVGKGKNFVYDDKRRLGTYTGNAQLDGAQGNLTADKIEVFLKADVNEVERLEAYAPEDQVVVKEAKRTVRGARLTYTAARDEYLMTGAPVTVIEEEEKGMCRVGRFGSITFQRGAEVGEMKGIGQIPGESGMQPCSSVKR